jgi:hypothetical protein
MNLSRPPTHADGMAADIESAQWRHDEAIWNWSCAYGLFNISNFIKRNSIVRLPNRLALPTCTQVADATAELPWMVKRHFKYLKEQGKGFAQKRPTPHPLPYTFLRQLFRWEAHIAN